MKVKKEEDECRVQVTNKRSMASGGIREMICCRGISRK